MAATPPPWNKNSPLSLFEATYLIPLFACGGGGGVQLSDEYLTVFTPWFESSLFFHPLNSQSVGLTSYLLQKAYSGVCRKMQEKKTVFLIFETFRVVWVKM